MASRRAAPAVLAAFVLHHHDWSESSLILELFTREYGRVVAVAKGAKRPYSQLRCVLLPFQRLQVALGSKRIEDGAEVQLLRSAEWIGPGPMPAGSALLAGLYLNELLLRGLARHDPHPRLFDAYAETLPALSAGGDDARLAAALRAFEIRLLAESGVWPQLDRVTLTQAPVDADSRYGLDPEAGVRAVRQGETGLSGATLAALEQALHDDAPDALRRTCAAAPGTSELRTQLRQLLHYHLGTTTLRTRTLMVEVQKIIDAAPH